MIVGSTFYFVIGVIMGMAMSMTENYTLSPVHAHVNLLGWVSLALGGLLYQLYPAAANSRLGKWHFWLHMLGIPLMMTGLACMLLMGSAAFVAAVSVGGVFVVVGTILFSANAVRHMS
jgi:cbb3-type cytochrome oxidase subunit 1